jgi:hypothetical protein
MGAAFAFAEPPSQKDDLSESIEYLLDFVTNSECTFIRNEKEHTPQEAAAHMRKKYDHFKHEIKTPEDFIRLAASRSLMTKKPYVIRTKDGKIMPSETWLQEALRQYRKEMHSPKGKKSHTEFTEPPSSRAELLRGQFSSNAIPLPRETFTDPNADVPGTPGTPMP